MQLLTLKETTEFIKGKPCYMSEKRRGSHLSTHIAMPIPPPMHKAATPRFPPVRSSACTRVTRMREPDAPRGCPRATAPPEALTCQKTKPCLSLTVVYFPMFEWLCDVPQTLISRTLFSSYHWSKCCTCFFF